MRWAGIFLLFGLAMAAGWFLPDAEPGTPQAATNVVPDAAANSDSTDDLTETTDETILARQGDGHFYANVDVNDTEIRFMVDTGATGIALNAEDAEALGLAWHDGELHVVGRGVSGDVYGKRVKLRSVQLGDLQAHDVDAVIVPRGLDVSLLGQSFLSKAASLRIENDEMVIG